MVDYLQRAKYNRTKKRLGQNFLINPDVISDIIEFANIQPEDVILEIEVQGALNVKAKNPEALLLFVTPPSAEKLKRRLIGRGTETLEVINERMARAAEEALLMDRYDYLIINDKLEECTETIHQLVQREHLRMSANLDMVEKIKRELEEMKGE